MLAALALLLLGVGALSYYALNTACPFWTTSCTPVETVVAESSAPPASSEEIAPSEVSAVAPASSAPAADGPEQWRAIIANPETSEADLLALGSRLRADPADAVAYDLGYQALFEAASAKNSVEAQKLIAAASDPLTPGIDAGSTNIRTALTFYRRAAQAGDRESTQRLEALCAWARGTAGVVTDRTREAVESNCE
jgi:hypothetical protein